MKLFTIVFILLLSFNAYAHDLVYSPKKDITTYELSEVMKIFYFDIYNKMNRRGFDPTDDPDKLVNFYNTFDPSVKRHFYIKEEK